MVSSRPSARNFASGCTLPVPGSSHVRSTSWTHTWFHSRFSVTGCGGRQVAWPLSAMGYIRTSSAPIESARNRSLSSSLRHPQIAQRLLSPRGSKKKTVAARQGMRSLKSMRRRNPGSELHLPSASCCRSDHSSHGR